MTTAFADPIGAADPNPQASPGARDPRRTRPDITYSFVTGLPCSAW